MQSLQRFNKSYPGLFDTGDDEEGSDDGSGKKPNKQFHQRYGWIYSTEQVARMEGVSIDHVWNMGVVNVLNDLSYLKAKAAHEKELVREAMK